MLWDKSSGHPSWLRRLRHTPYGQLHACILTAIKHPVNRFKTAPVHPELSVPGIAGPVSRFPLAASCSSGPNQPGKIIRGTQKATEGHEASDIPPPPSASISQTLLLHCVYRPLSKSSHPNHAKRPRRPRTLHTLHSWLPLEPATPFATTAPSVFVQPLPSLILTLCSIAQHQFSHPTWPNRTPTFKAYLQH
jgi:hypothetical protein